MTNNPFTINDIAKLLGISKSTVSRALRDHPDISERTKENVRRVAMDLDYRPNIVASSLRRKKSRLIGIIVPQISYFFFPSVIKGVENIAQQRGYNLLIMHSNESYEREVESVETLVSNNVEGILASISRQTRDFDHFRKIIDMGLPLVFYDRVVTDLMADTVMIDDRSASFNAINHLIANGRKRIAILTGNLNLLISQNRLRGYTEALKGKGLRLDNELIISCEWPEEAEAAIYQLFSRDDPPDAIFGISDLITSGIMRALYKLDKKVPEEVAVIGFCEEPLRSLYNPSVTSVEPKGYEIGKLATEILLDRIDNGIDEHSSPKIMYLEGDIIIKNST